jgi:hypothetical protein
MLVVAQLVKKSFVLYVISDITNILTGACSESPEPQLPNSITSHFNDYYPRLVLDLPKWSLPVSFYY